MTSPGTDGHRWFALQVRTRWEGSTAVLLSGKGYQTLLPTYKTKKRWNGRPKATKARRSFPAMFSANLMRRNVCQFLLHPV